MPALVTPFTRAGLIDDDSHRHNLGVLSDVGIDGFLLGGSTGEGPLLEPGERRRLTAVARETLGRRPHLTVGISAESVRQAGTQIAEAEEGGADAVLVLTPTTLARTSLDAQRRYFTEVAAASPLPVLLYSVPKNTGYALDEALSVELAGLDNVVGMKDSGGDAARIQRIAGASPDGFVVYNGASASLMLAVIGGAHGGITASTNYAPSLVLELVKTAKRSPAKAADLQARLMALSRLVEGNGIGGVKAAAAAAGLAPGSPRKPFTNLPKRRRDELAEAVARI
jgi:4-hydroxy-2-oxoglutarate aldolase